MKDIYCSFYTESDEILKYMVSVNDIANKKLRILEPSVGEGAFVDMIISINKNSYIECLDINPLAISEMNKKYLNNNKIIIRESDFLFDNIFDKIIENNIQEQKFDRVIGNPPYGARQDYKKRLLLKNKYSELYVKETYTLFLYRGINLLKEGGKLTFIIPDTFLYLNMHKNLRKFLLEETEIEEISIFNSNLFPGVNFGYSSLSIITVKKNKNKNNKIRIIKGIKESSDFTKLSNNEYDDFDILYLEQDKILKNDNYRFIITEKESFIKLLDKGVKLGEYANVVTGFYTGDNIKFLRVRDYNVKNSKNYELIDINKVFKNSSLNGINDIDEGYVEYVKGSSTTKYKRFSNERFVRRDSNTINFYNSNKKSRFQNSSFYFRKGIALPMIKSSNINATIIDNCVFDQSIVGVFPKNEKYFKYILSLLNSDIICKIINLINPTANNSANYIKLIPFYVPSNNELSKINSMVDKILESDVKEIPNLHKELNNYVSELYIKIIDEL